MKRSYTYVINFILDQTVPLKTMLVKASHPKWITSEFKKLVHKRDVYKKEFIKFRTTESWEAFRHMRNTVVRLKRKLKANELKVLAAESKNKLKKAWQMFNDQIGRGKVMSLRKKGIYP